MILKYKNNKFVRLFMEENKFTEKDYLEAQYKIQRSIQANVNVIAFVVIIQLLLTIAVLVFYILNYHLF